jgi:hypothetical protein
MVVQGEVLTIPVQKAIIVYFLLLLLPVAALVLVVPPEMAAPEGQVVVLELAVVLELGVLVTKADIHQLKVITEVITLMDLHFIQAVAEEVLVLLEVTVTVLVLVV